MEVRLTSNSVIDLCLNSTTLGELARDLVPEIMERVHASAGSVLVRDGDVLLVHTSYGLKKNRSQEAQIPVGAGVTGQAAVSDELQWIPDVGEIDNHIEGVSGSEWELAIPLSNSGSRTQVVFDIESDQTRRPSADMRDEIRNVLESVKIPVLNLAEKFIHRRASKTDGLSSLLDGDYFYRYLEDFFNESENNEAVLFMMTVEPETNGSSVLPYEELALNHQKIGEQIRSFSDMSISCSRVYGNVFAIFIPGAHLNDVASYRRRIYDQLSDVCQITSMDWSHYPSHVSSPRDLFYQAFPGIDSSRSDTPDRSRADTLREILDTGSINLKYQPIYDFDGMDEIGCELLVRGPSETDLESPKYLFEVARRNDLLNELDALITRSVADSRFDIGNECLFLNIERRSLRSTVWRDAFYELISGNHFSEICLEITEHSMIDDIIDDINDIRNQYPDSVKFAIDDFGTGSSNLQALIEFEPDIIKIDRSIVQGIESSFGKRSLIESITNFAKTNEINIVAEGIETEKESSTLKSLGIDLAQGYLFQKPAKI